MIVRNFADWDRLSHYEQRLENQFYKAPALKLRLWRKEKASLAREMEGMEEPDPIEEDDAIEEPDSPATDDGVACDSSIPSNEPTAEISPATLVPTETCDDASRQNNELLSTEGGNNEPQMYADERG